MTEHRRSRRILASVPLEVEVEGRSHRVLTAVINLHGAMILSPVKWPSGSELRVENTDTRVNVTARVVWCGDQSPRGSYKIGIEFEAASPEFWGERYNPHAVEVPWNK
jgi:PilZ domain